MVSGHVYLQAPLPSWRNAGTHWVGGWVVPRADLDGFGEDKNLLPVAGFEPMTVGLHCQISFERTYTSRHWLASRSTSGLYRVWPLERGIWSLQCGLLNSNELAADGWDFQNKQASKKFLWAGIALRKKACGDMEATSPRVQAGWGSIFGLACDWRHGCSRPVCHNQGSARNCGMDT